jgi:hypothetical protein
VTESPAPQNSGTIEIRISDISQLFNTLDPFPFPERDLDKDAEEFIVGWARELPRGQPLRIVIHLSGAETAKHNATQLREALNRYFAYRASVIERDIKEMFRVGRLSLVIGLAVLAASFSAAQFLAGRNEAPIGRFVEESLIIVAWVANWRPIEIFLYDWWPLVRRRNLHRRLAAASVEIKPY